MRVLIIEDHEDMAAEFGAYHTYTEIVAAFDSLALLYPALLSASVVLLDELAFRHHPSRKDLWKLLAFSALENLGYRQLLSLLRARALLAGLEPDLIVLAGFLWKLSDAMVEAYPERIVNIHPALLPKYGGKGMYGMHVHQAVVENKEAETGITIHFVNEAYDEGAIIFQARTAVTPELTPEDVAANVHELEYAHFPRVIEELLNLEDG